MSAFRFAGARILLSPREPLVGGGAAEAFEQQLQQLLRNGYRNLVVDLTAVSAIDSAGIRALVRGHTSARRMDGTLRLAAARWAVSDVLKLSNLSGIFEMYESVDGAMIAAWPWAAIRSVAGGTALCVMLVWIGLKWPAELTGIGSLGSALTGGGEATGAVSRFQPFLELGKLVAAALIGMLVTAVHKPSSRDRPGGRSMEQAQMLLCVSGALMMIIIGNSLARAFGIAGAASIIRFRTPVDDPKDVTILFLLMGLGMSTGLGAFAVAGLGTAFLCLTLVALDAMAKQQTRLMSVEIVASGRAFPSTRVEECFARNQIIFEPREIAQSDDVTVKYHVWLDPRMSLDELSAQLMKDTAGVTAVAWEHPKRV
ncbi:MAG TPA: STAS domain-containing protein [Vicinamibacterales bacterium]|nr:STAS domain-containing protein [Vicinamibacterales bacterium]